MTEEIRKILDEAQKFIDNNENKSCKIEMKKDDDEFIRQETRCEGCDG